MARIKFEKGKQREFFDKVLAAVGSPSLRELLNRGVSVGYQTLKNYYSERRLLSENLFEELLQIANLHHEDFDFEIVDENWGQVKGGKKSRR